MSLFRTRRAALAALLAVVLAGCGHGPPKPADVGRARETLRAALDAWKAGEAPEALQRRRPPVYALDHEWRDGRRLVGYEVKGDEPYGGDLRCRVTLSLQDAAGRPVAKEAVYAVGTSPALTVSREEDP